MKILATAALTAAAVIGMTATLADVAGIGVGTVYQRKRQGSEWERAQAGCSRRSADSWSLIR